jgi:hypothetical protein
MRGAVVIRSASTREGRVTITAESRSGSDLKYRRSSCLRREHLFWP